MTAMNILAICIGGILITTVMGAFFQLITNVKGSFPTDLRPQNYFRDSFRSVVLNLFFNWVTLGSLVA